MKTIDYRFHQALSPKQGVCRAECIEAMADDYATGPGQSKNLRSLYDYDRRLWRIKGVIQGRKQGVSEASPALRTETTMFSSGPFKSHLLGQSKPWYTTYQGFFPFPLHWDLDGFRPIFLDGSLAGGSTFTSSSLSVIIVGDGRMFG
jgi:hypothetical protein